MNISKLKSVHFVGIGGIGISATARLMLAQGKAVSGSDRVESDSTSNLRKLGARISIGHDADNVRQGTQLLVYSDAVKLENPERAKARDLSIPELSYFQFLGELTKGYETIAVSGTHGKTTTTAMAGLVFDCAGRDPMVIVGSAIPQFGGNLRQGTGKEFIVEAEEYREHMLELAPHAVMLTNIEADHLDYYRDLDHIIASFQAYVDRVPPNGLVVYNADDPALSKKLTYNGKRVRSYAIEAPADIRASDIEIGHGKTGFSVLVDGVVAGRVALRIPGAHNVSNALAVIALGLDYGIPFATIANALGDYRGAWRRFEVVGDVRGATVISDYGHHPTEIKKTMEGARAWYGDKKLVLVFQPHQIDRTKKLFSEFVTALAQAPAQTIIISDIYEVAGREEGGEIVTSADLVREIRREAGDSKEILYGGNLEETKKLAREHTTPGSVVMLMGAGTIDAAARELVAHD